MKKILLLIAILAANVFVYATIFDEPEAEQEVKLCRGYKPKSYGHLTVNILNTEFVECCVPSKIRHWCDFLSDSPLCKEHLKHRPTDICINLVITEEPEEDNDSDIEQQF